jgi:hypothetical protein
MHRFLRPSDALSLPRDLEEVLVELRALGAESYARELEIRVEISEIRGDLARFGLL